MRRHEAPLPTSFVQGCKRNTTLLAIRIRPGGERLVGSGDWAFAFLIRQFPPWNSGEITQEISSMPAVQKPVVETVQNGVPDR